VNYTFYMGGQESRIGGCDSVSEDDQEGTEDASDGGSGRHGHKEGHTGKWLPQHVCDSCQQEDNLTLMKSEFHPRHIVRETRRLQDMP
jgi:hypothetical protein